MAIGEKEHEGLLSPKDLADHLQIPPATLDRWASLGGGPPFLKIGRHRRYDPRAVRDWLDAQANDPRRKPQEPARTR